VTVNHRPTGHRFTVHRSHRSTGSPFTGLTGPPVHRPPVSPVHRSTVHRSHRSTVHRSHRSTVHRPPVSPFTNLTQFIVQCCQSIVKVLNIEDISFVKN
jgi:hypothetical protein